jgi:hypothetical protein
MKNDLKIVINLHKTIGKNKKWFKSRYSVKNYNKK